MKPHQFQSITEAQWKSGLSRRKCALCAYDYDDPVHGLLDWPLVIVIQDGIEPTLTPFVLEMAAGMDDEERIIQFICAKINAEYDLRVN